MASQRPRSRRLSRRRALALAGGGAAVALGAGAIAVRTPMVRRRVWQVEDSIWARRSWYDITARNRLPLDGIEHQRLTFGPDPRQYALWFHPQDRSLPQRDLLLYIHGGGWRSGSPDYHLFLGRHFAAQGFPTVLAGYRLLPDATLPDMLEDLAEGLRLGIERSRERGWRGGVTLIGGSAGGHLGALLAFAGGALLADAGVAGAIDGLVTLAGVLNFSLPGPDDLACTAAELMGPGRDPLLADPLRHVTAAGRTRVLCVHGQKDWLVDPRHSRTFVKRVNQNGSDRAELLLVPNRHHADLLEVLYRDSRVARRLSEWLGATTP